MGFYLIGIGGTGAKCVEALIHLAAAGMAPKGEVYTFFVDPDRSNGSLGRAEETLSTYRDCQQIRLGETDLFRTRFKVGAAVKWTPLSQVQDGARDLNTLFKYNQLTTIAPLAAHFFDVLYSPAEKKTTLDKGFRGHPSIGAAVMAERINLGDPHIGEPWRSLVDGLASDAAHGETSHVLLVGSIFGGTGASGIPTIARLIQEAFKHVRMGAVLMLPYFSFDDPPTEDGLNVNAASFLVNTQTALKYYAERDDLRPFNSVYLLGADSTSKMPTSIGGSTQANRPHFLELYAGMAAIDFFADPASTGYRLVARGQDSRLNWVDVPPYPGKPRLLEAKIRQFLRFAVSYRFLFYPMILDIDKKGAGFRAPWYVDHFRRGGNSFADVKTDLRLVEKYCRQFLWWMGSIHKSVDPAEIGIQLANADVFTRYVDPDQPLEVLEGEKDFDPGKFSRLMLPQREMQSKRSDDLSHLWERLSDTGAVEGADGAGRFIHVLYRECA